MYVNDDLNNRKCDDLGCDCEGANHPRDRIPVLMPQAGNTMEEGTIVAWRVKVGDCVAVGQVLCEIETDKATVEVEATHAGQLAQIVADTGAVVPVKQPIAYLASEDARAADLAFPSTAELPHPESRRVKASPMARKIAAERGIDLARVAPGSGPGGRILSTDLAGLSAKCLQPTPAKIVTPPSPTLAGAIRRPMSKMRKAIALNLQTSKQTIPHFYVKATINADPLLAFYKAQNPATGCTLNDVLLLAVGRVVGEMPAFRSRADGGGGGGGGGILEMPSADIGVAVTVPEGLVVPVVLGVHALTLPQLAAEARRVVDAARNGKLENLGKAVFTISNMGMLGVEDFAAIINPPESGILAISAIREDVIVKDGALRPGRVMSLTLSVDHRVVDGAVAAQFMNRLREILESPDTLLR
jgi:pyruvate dehydrogenase E2 component (dihydrolipoamide acetyltransferase)